MKKKLLFLIIFCFFLLLVLSTNSFAMFTKEQYTINATLLQNGNMYVEEIIEYNTNETRNGVTRTIKLQNPENTKNSATGFELKGVYVDGELCTEVTGGRNGQDKVYEYSYSSGYEAYIKLYTPFEYEGKTVKYVYTLSNVAVEYNDIAEIYWNFVGSDSSDRTENLTINITLPAVAANDTIYVYGHGSDNGTFEKDGNYITLKAENIASGQAVDARILFSKDAVNTTKTVNQNVLQKYRNMEEGMNNDVYVVGTITVNQLAAFLTIIILVIFVMVFLKYHHKKIRHEQYVRELPYGLEPEVLQTVYYGRIKENAFWITFLNLVKKGVFKIEKDINKVNREKYNIIFERDDILVPEYEQKVVETITGCMSEKNRENKEYVELTKLKAKLQRSTSYKGYTKFANSLQTEVDSIFGEDKKPKKLRIFVTLAMIVFILIIMMIATKVTSEGFEEVMIIPMMLGFTTLVYSIFFINIKFNLPVVIFLIFHCGAFQIGNISILNSLDIGILYIPYILLFILLIYCYRVKEESKEKKEARGQIQGLKNYIKNYSMLSERELQDITLWGEYLIMAIALGVNKRTVNYFYNGCAENLGNDFGNNLVVVGSYAVFSSSFATTFNSIRTTSSSGSGSSRGGYSGSSGGFSGGSSSGGGGRRWRRNRFLLKNKIILATMFITTVANSCIYEQLRKNKE